MSEIERIEQNIDSQDPPEVRVSIEASSDTPQEALNRIISVVMVILNACNTDWPDDLWWKQQLPSWFIDSFNHSLDEIKNDPSLWDFGSWIDAVKYRGWEWWSSGINGQRIEIKLHAYDDPYVLSPLEYIMKSSGVSNIKHK